MAVLYITELEALGTPSVGGHLPIAYVPPVTEQTLAISGSSAASAAFSGQTRFVRLTCDVTCSLAFGPTPTAQSVSGTQTGAAAVGTARLPAGEVEYFAVSPNHKVAVISTS